MDTMVGDIDLDSQFEHGLQIDRYTETNHYKVKLVSMEYE